MRTTKSTRREPDFKPDSPQGAVEVGGEAVAFGGSPIMIEGALVFARGI
jgi:hypothetical protein